MGISNRKLMGAFALAGILIVAAGAGIWSMFLSSDAPPPVSLDDAVASLATATSTVDETDESTAVPQSNASQAQAGEVWSLTAGSDSFVGYRIGEELATIGTAEAVGRTPSVTGEVVISGTLVESAAFEANLLDLASDDSRRDQTLQDRGLETASYPTATFELTQPVELGSELVEGAAYSVVAAGDLTLHGVSQPVEIQLEAQYSGGSLVIVGALDIALADYDITPPTTQIALSVDDHDTIELQLILDRVG